MPQASMWLKKQDSHFLSLGLLLPINTRANILFGFLVRFCRESASPFFCSDMPEITETPHTHPKPIPTR